MATESSLITQPQLNGEACPRDYNRPDRSDPCDRSERGMALIGVMLIMSLLLMLGLAVTFTSVSDKAITSNFKNTTAGFYAAEAGTNNLHRLLRSDRFVLASVSDPPKVTPGMPTLNERDFTVAAEEALARKEVFPNLSAYTTNINIKEFRVPYPASDSNPAHAGKRVKYINPAFPRLGQVEPYSVAYELESVGQGIEGLNGMVTLKEEGVIDFKLLVRAEGGGIRVGTFSEFALYLDRFNPYTPEGPFIYQGLGPGDRFAGRVHTNERLGFWTPADGSNPPTFRGLGSGLRLMARTPRPFAATLRNPTRKRATIDTGRAYHRRRLMPTRRLWAACWSRQSSWPGLIAALNRFHLPEMPSTRRAQCLTEDSLCRRGRQRMASCAKRCDPSKT